MKTRLLVCLLPLLASTAAAQRQVWTVDDDLENGPDFQGIGAAAAFAGEGDLILVASGTYSSFTVDGKSLTVVADLDSDVLIQEQPPVGGAPPPPTLVTVRNLRFQVATATRW